MQAQSYSSKSRNTIIRLNHIASRKKTVWQSNKHWWYNHSIITLNVTLHRSILPQGKKSATKQDVSLLNKDGWPKLLFRYITIAAFTSPSKNFDCHSLCTRFHFGEKITGMIRKLFFFSVIFQKCLVQKHMQAGIYSIKARTVARKHTKCQWHSWSSSAKYGNDTQRRIDYISIADKLSPLLQVMFEVPSITILSPNGTGAFRLYISNIHF